MSNNSQPNIENDVIKRRVRRTVDSSVCFTDVIHTTMNIEPTPAGAVDEWSIAIGRGFESQQRWLQITTAKLSTAGCYKPTQSIRPWGIYAISRPTGARHDHRLLGEKCMFRTTLNSEALYRLSQSWVLAWSVEDTRYPGLHHSSHRTVCVLLFQKPRRATDSANFTFSQESHSDTQASGVWWKEGQ